MAKNKKANLQEMITIRLNLSDYKKVQRNAEKLGISESEYFRDLLKDDANKKNGVKVAARYCEVKAVSQEIINHVREKYDCADDDYLQEMEKRLCYTGEDGNLAKNKKANLQKKITIRLKSSDRKKARHYADILGISASEYFRNLLVDNENKANDVKAAARYCEVKAVSQEIINHVREKYDYADDDYLQEQEERLWDV